MTQSSIGYESSRTQGRGRINKVEVESRNFDVAQKLSTRSRSGLQVLTWPRSVNVCN